MLKPAFSKKQKKKGSPILRKIMIPMLFLALLQILIFTSAMLINGEFSSIKTYSYNNITEKTKNRRNYVETTLNQKTELVYETANEVNRITRQILSEENLDASAVMENKALNKRILSESASSLVSLIRRNMVNDAFILLNTDQLYNEGDTVNRTGIYLRDTDINENSFHDNKDIYMEMGNSEIARNLGLSLDFEWSLYLNATNRENGNFDFFYSPIETYADNQSTPIYNLGCWTGFSRISDSAMTSMKYTLPLVADDGTVYGVIGIGLLEKTIRYAIPTNDFSDDASCYVLAADLDNSDNYTPLLTSGSAYGKLTQKDTILNREHKLENNLYTFSATDKNCIGSIQDMNLYNSGSPYRDQKWALVCVTNKHVALSTYNTLIRIFILSAGITLLVGISFALLVSKTISNPVTRMVQALAIGQSKNQIVQFRSSGISEINRLADAIVELQIHATEYASRVSHIIAMAGSEIGVFMYDFHHGTVFMGASLIKLLHFDTLPEQDTTISMEEFQKQLCTIDPENQVLGREIFHTEEGSRANQMSDELEIQFSSINDDTVRWYQFRLIRDDENVIGLVQDITDTVEEKKEIAKIKDDEYTAKLIKANVALQDAYATAKQANNAKTDFLSRMSHDIRTPMNAIIGMTAIANTHLDDRAKIADCLGKIDTSSRYLLSLINEVLDMSKIESGKFVLNEEEITLSKLIRNFIEMVQPAVESKKHTFLVHIGKITHEHVIGDSLRIQQVFMNIMSNAVKYTPPGGKIELTVMEKTFRLQKVGCYTFAFRDNGIGMSSEFLQRLFEPFERASDVRVNKEQGTGLGMPIAKNIVSMMDGDIKVESQEGVGTTFTVTIYLKLQDKSLVSTESLPSMRVLIADNDPVNCQNICQTLTDLKIQCEWVLSGEEVLKKFHQAQANNTPYHAIILDYEMADMNGIQTAKAIRNIEKNQNLTLILSAFDWSEMEEEAKEAGINAFVQKPIFQSELITVLKTATSNIAPIPEQTDNSTFFQNDFSGNRALVVDDNELNREIASEILSMIGLEIDIAENGQEAVERFSASQIGYYQMIFMDIQMPVMNGHDATRAIRALSREDAKSVPIVAMTANAFAEDVQASKAAGMNEHIAKPLDFKRLLEVLNQWLS